MSKKHIVIAGNIGSGKTTLSKILGESFDVRVVNEPYNDCPYLRDFYDPNAQKNPFAQQSWFLTEKLKIHNSIVSGEFSVVQDTCVYDVVAFAAAMHATGLMSELDFNTYVSMYNAVMSNLRPPDGIIFLDHPVKTLKERISKRGRDFEKKIDETYLLFLDNSLRKYLSEMYLKRGVQVVSISNPDIYDNEKVLFIKRVADKMLNG